ncbi:MAG: CcmD family protein [Bacillota bacterium]|nr:CcmD family protein [Bacillota bacterium]MDI7248664.1 CcmD family protein [Bacillota bacterium]
MTYLFLGYTAIWTLLFVYFLYVSGRQRALERDLRWIREHLEAREQSGRGRGCGK